MRGVVVDDVWLPPLLPPPLLPRTTAAGLPFARSVVEAAEATAPAFKAPVAATAFVAAPPPSALCDCRYPEGDRWCLALTAFGSPPSPRPSPTIAGGAASLFLPVVWGSSAGRVVSVAPTAGIPVAGTEDCCSTARAIVSAAARVKGVEWFTSEAWPPLLRLAVYHECRGLFFALSLSLSSESSLATGMFSQTPHANSPCGPGCGVGWGCARVAVRASVQVCSISSASYK